MDITIEKNQQPLVLRYWQRILAATVIAAVVIAALQFEVTAFSAHRNELLIGTVQQGELLINVRGNGSLVSSDVRWIAANVEGRVDSIFVKPGALVSKGQTLMVLSNPLLRQQAEEIRWELTAQEEQNKALAVTLATQLLDQKAVVINAQMLYESAKLKLDAEQTLLDQGQGTVSMLDYKKSKLETTQYKRRWAIEIERQQMLVENKTAQLRAQQARLQKQRNTLQRAEDQVTALTVMATIEGVVQEMPLEPGQQLLIGANIAKLARQDQLIAELNIPERQIRDVMLGQTAIIDTRLNQVKGKVVRINPTVTHGSVQVDVAFEGPLPSEARPDLSIEGYIEIQHLANTVYINRPAFAQSEASSSVYKLSEDGRYAQKTLVQFGIGSAKQIAIHSGLLVGDQVILSDHSAFEHINKIAID